MRTNGKLLVISIVTIMLVGAIPMGMLSGAAGPRAASRGSNVLTLTSAAVGLPATGEYPSIGMGKFNNDNNIDMASGMLAWAFGGGTNKGLYAWINNNGAQSWTSASTGLDPNGEYAQVAVGDINKDGFDEIVAPHETEWSGQATTGIVVYKSDGAATPTWTAMTPVTNLGGYYGVILIDVNKDGNLDIAATADATYNKGIHVWKGNGGTSWVDSSTGLPAAGSYFGIAAGDLNKDGNLDLVVGTGGTGVEVYKGDGGTTWTKATGTGLPSSGTYWAQNVTDLDNDGNPDIMFGSYDNGGLYAYTGNGALSFTSESTGLPNAKIHCQISVGDIDKNGYKDVWGGICDPQPTGFSLYLNNGNGGGALSWTKVVDAKIPAAGDYSGVALADVNNDGTLDLMGGGAGWTPPSNGMKLWTVKVTIPVPQPNAGIDQTVLVLDNVTLDGSASKANGGATIASYKWNFTSKPGGSTAALSDDTIAKPIFKADKIGLYALTLNIKDSNGKWGPVEAKVNVTANPWPNQRPIANPGKTQTVKLGTKVQLDGSASWDDQKVTAYNWNITAKPTDSNVSLSDEAIVNPTFTPDFIGDYKFTLTVKDINNTWSKDAPLTVKATAQGTAFPTANAGVDVVIELGQNVTLDGSKSTDDQKVMAYHWSVTTQPSGSNLVLLDQAVQNITPQVVGQYALTLTVKDNDNQWSEPAHMSINVLPRNLPPVAKIDKPENGAVFLSTAVVDFDGSKSSDPEAKDITLLWTSDKDGQLGTIDTFSKALSVGTHVISLAITDDHHQTTVAKVTITVKLDQLPTAVLKGAPVTILKGEKVDFDAKESSDVEGPIASFKLDFGDGTTPAWATAPTASHVYKTTGSFPASLVVKDGKGQLSTNAATITIKVGERPTAAVTVDKPFIKVKQTVTISALNAKDGDGTVVGYYFDYGDKTNSGWVNTTSITKTYLTAGSYVITVKVKDNEGYESVNEATVTVSIEKVAQPANNMGGMLLPIALIIIVVVVIVVLIAVMMMRKKKAQAVQAQVDLVQQPPPPPAMYAGQDQTQQAPQPAYDPNQYQQQGYDQNQYQQQQYQGYQQPDQSGYQYPPPPGQ